MIRIQESDCDVGTKTFTYLCFTYLCMRVCVAACTKQRKIIVRLIIFRRPPPARASFNRTPETSLCTTFIIASSSS